MPSKPDFHQTIDPAILYFGTPVVIISTENEDGTYNLAPMSSAWWLHDRCILGLGKNAQTWSNLLRTGQCVLNLPTDDMVSYVDLLAKTTGVEDIAPRKAAMGYTYVKDKFKITGLHPVESCMIRPPRILECPIQMEAVLVTSHDLKSDLAAEHRTASAIEVKIIQVHAKQSVQLAGQINKIDPDKWRPLIMSFQHFYGLSSRSGNSKLATINEEMYRTVKRQPNLWSPDGSKPAEPNLSALAEPSRMASL
ncbi:hypothetical protein NQZ79_g5617 [Umbelopsis isabellina]|nr:hypothetical protein NQZ79_g5617 [Umbelopsis isabellina]